MMLSEFLQLHSTSGVPTLSVLLVSPLCLAVTVFPLWEASGNCRKPTDQLHETLTISGLYPPSRSVYQSSPPRNPCTQISSVSDLSTKLNESATSSLKIRLPSMSVPENLHKPMPMITTSQVPYKKVLHPTSLELTSFFRAP